MTSKISLGTESSLISTTVCGLILEMSSDKLDDIAFDVVSGAVGDTSRDIITATVCDTATDTVTDASRDIFSTLGPLRARLCSCIHHSH